MSFAVVMWHHQADLWPLGHKVNFDPLEKEITVHPSVTAVNVQRDIYSDSKEWALLRDYLRFRPSIRSVGGDPLPDGTPLGRTYFLTNGWKIIVDHGVTFDGNLYSDDYASPFEVEAGVQLVSYKFSNLVDVAQPDLSSLSIPSSSANASAVWLSATRTLTSGIPTPAENANGFFDLPAGVEASMTLRQAMRIVMSALAGKASGMEGANVAFRDTNDTKNRIQATTDQYGNRTSVTLDKD